MIIKLQNGNILKLSKEESDYLNWRKLSPEQKRQIRINKAKAYLNSGPNITNFWEAFQTYIGNRDPENPNLNTGEAPSPGWGKQGVTGLHKMIAKLPEAKQTLLAPLAGRSRAAAIIKDKNIVEAQKHRDEVYRRWASLYKQEHDPTPTTFRTNPAKIKRQESNVANSNARTLAGGKANAGGSYSSKSHTIRVTTSNNVSAKNLEDIAFHEGIHSYGLGESPSYVWKSKYLNFPEGTNPYFLDPREIATHGIQQGQNLGIKVGQAYPGKEAMIKMIENRPEGQGFGGVPMILYNNAKTNADYRRLWSLLNGTFKNGGSIKAANARKWKHKEGGIIKAEEGTKTNWVSKIGEGINKGVNSKAGQYIAQGLQLGLGSIFGGNNSSDISNVAKNYNIQQQNAYDEQELYKLYSLMKSSVDPENPNANKGVPMQILPGKIRDIEKRMLERQIQQEEINTQLKLDNQKSNLYQDIFSTALGVISNNNSNKTTKNNTSQLNGSPSKTTITSTNNNILKTGYEPYKSGYVDQFGNISTGMGFKFDKNFNVVPFDKSFNYQPLKLNV